MNYTVKTEEQLTKGLICRYLENGIVRFDFSDMTREIVDLWIAKAHELDQVAIAEKRTMAYLCDYRKCTFITPYMMGQVAEANRNAPPELKAYVAILPVNRGFFGVAQRMLGRIVAGRDLGGFQVFLEESLALAWLDDKLKQA
jgi:hypothetical protein